MCLRDAVVADTTLDVFLFTLVHFWGVGSTSYDRMLLIHSVIADSVEYTSAIWHQEQYRAVLYVRWCKNLAPSSENIRTRGLTRGMA